MSLKYVLHLTASERQALTQIAKGRGGHRHPDEGKVERARALLKCDAGPEGAGETDEAIAAALDISASRVGRWRRQAVAEGPEAVLERRARAPRSGQRDGAGEAQLLQLAQSTPPAGPARWILRLRAHQLEARAVVTQLSYETVRRTPEKDELPPWRRLQRCYPPVCEAEFVGPMEEVLDLYGQPYDARYPVICMDERPKQLLAERQTPHPARSGRPATYDHEYVRHGACAVWLFVEPLGQWRTANATARRTAADWARQVQALVDHPRYRRAERLTLVCNNLNTHAYASFYRAFPPDAALRLARRVRLVFTPRHGTWLNMAEPELSILTRQVLAPCMATQAEVHAQAAAWAEACNAAQTGIDWQFRTEDARVQIKKLYPIIKT